MSFPLVNSIISWFLKKRKHQIELFLKYPLDVQDELLFKLLKLQKIQNSEKSIIFLPLEIIPISKMRFRFRNTKLLNH